MAFCEIRQCRKTGQQFMLTPQEEVPVMESIEIDGKKIERAATNSDGTPKKTKRDAFDGCAKGGPKCSTRRPEYAKLPEVKYTPGKGMPASPWGGDHFRVSTLNQE